MTEARAIAPLRHPNIVAVHDVVQDEGIHAYAMEWVDGKSLGRLIEYLQKRSDEGEIRAGLSPGRNEATGERRHEGTEARSV